MPSNSPVVLLRPKDDPQLTLYPLGTAMPWCTARGVSLVENGVRGSAVGNRRSLVTGRFWVDIERRPGGGEAQGQGNSLG